MLLAKCLQKGLLPWPQQHFPALCALAAWRTSTSAAQKKDEQLGPASEATDAAEGATPPAISPAALLELKAAFKQASQASRAASNLATLSALSGHYRDTFVSMEALYWQQIEEYPAALASAPAPPRPTQPRASYHSCTLFPLIDVTALPDNHSSLPPGPGLQLDVKAMDKITCWKQLQPNHIETSTHLLSGISLFPPQEATYPTYVDFQAALRLLRTHKSRKRMSKMRRIRTRQDKYQLKTWDHHIGE